jgi:LacI family transcriptional regulator
MGYSLVVCDTDENLDLEIEHTNLLLSKRVDGLIIMPVGQSCDHLRKLRKEGMPFVLVDRTFDELEASSVVVDNYRGAFDAVEHLIEYGHTKIAIIQGLPNTSTNMGRLKGYLDALAKHGITPVEELMVGNSFRTATGYVETKVLLSMPSPPTAIFATSDLITLGVLEAIEEEGLSIPNDISLAVFDEIDFGPFLKCPLTTVAQPKENMGELAVKILVDQLKSKQKKETKRIVLKPTLVRRNSVRDLSSARRVAGEPLSVPTPVSC